MSPLLTFTATLETAINLWLKNDDRSKPRLHRLQGKVIELHLQEFSGSLFFFTAARGVQVLTHYEGSADATITSSMTGLIASHFKNTEDALFSGNIKIAGDTELGEQFQELLTDVDFDWEEQLSRITGDVMAHQAGKLVQGARQLVSQGSATLMQDTTEYLQEEARLLPTRLEIEHFLEQVDDLRSDFDRLDARLQRLQKNQASAQ